MPLPHVLENVKSCTGVYLRCVQYEVAVAFVQGFDAAVNGGLLIGFREWLVVRLGGGNNLAWPEILLRLMPAGHSGEPPDAEVARVAFLFSMLDEFVTERELPNGVRSIFNRYEEWLRAQEWYGPASPDWLPRFGE